MTHYAVWARLLLGGDMRSAENPYSPGAGNPPPELAGREEILDRASSTLERTLNRRMTKSLMMLGLRGVGKTVLLNRIQQMADDAGCAGGRSHVLR